MAQRRDVPNQEFKLRLLASQIRTVSRRRDCLAKNKNIRIQRLDGNSTKNFLHFIHSLRIGRTLFALSPPACFARHDGGEGWWLGADVRPDIRNTMSGQAWRTDDLDAKDHSRLSEKGEAGRSGGNCLSRSARSYSRSGLGKTWPARPEDRRPRKCGRQRYPIPETYPHLRVFSG